MAIRHGNDASGPLNDLSRKTRDSQGGMDVHRLRPDAFTTRR